MTTFIQICLEGLVVGSLYAVIALGFFAYDPLPLCFCLFLIASTGLFGFAKSPSGYAWLIFAITANLVILMALDQPQTAFTIAVNRVADVAIGTAPALLVTFLLPAPPACKPQDGQARLCNGRFASCATRLGTCSRVEAAPSLLLA